MPTYPSSASPSESCHVDGLGFTLLEILVVLAVLAMLASLTWPSVRRMFDKRELLAPLKKCARRWRRRGSAHRVRRFSAVPLAGRRQSLQHGPLRRPGGRATAPAAAASPRTFFRAIRSKRPSPPACILATLPRPAPRAEFSSAEFPSVAARDRTGGRGSRTCAGLSIARCGADRAVSVDRLPGEWQDLRRAYHDLWSRGPVCPCGSARADGIG